MKKLFLYLLIAILPVCSLSAANVDFNKHTITDKDSLKYAKKNLRKGDKLYKRMLKKSFNPEVPRIINLYKNAQSVNPNNAELNYKLGRTYMETTDRSYAAHYFEQAIVLDSLVKKDVFLQAARANHLSHNFDKAVSQYNSYLNSLKKKERTKQNATIQRYIKECNIGKKMIDAPVAVYVDNINILNTEYDEYGVVKNQDNSLIMFTSRREICECRAPEKTTGLYNETIMSSKRENNQFEEPVEAQKHLNKRGKHNAITYLSHDGENAIIYRSRPNGDLFQSEIKDKKKESIWIKPKRFARKISSRRYEENSLIYSSDMKEVFFSRKAGKGDKKNFDIFVAKKNEKGKWNKPVNLGAIVNSPYDEAGLFITDNDKTLYFSSNGHEGMGGFDIYKTVYENGNWSKPINLGYPINTAADDAFFSLTESQRSGYLSSNRDHGHGKLDIYSVTYFTPKPTVFSINNYKNIQNDLPLRGTVKEIAANVTLLEGNVTDENGENILAQIELVDNQKNITIAEFATDSISGKYSVQLPAGVNYGMAVKATGYLFHSENFDIPASAATQVITKNITLKKLEAGTNIVLNNIFFDTGKATLRKESVSELNRLLKLMDENPTMKIEISGHTDSQGRVASNKKLSEDRAKAVVDYLIDNSVDKERLSYKGYGSDVPVATNATAEGRQLNRRTEFKILEITNQ